MSLNTFWALLELVTLHICRLPHNVFLCLQSIMATFCSRSRTFGRVADYLVIIKTLTRGHFLLYLSVIAIIKNRTLWFVVFCSHLNFGRMNNNLSSIFSGTAVKKVENKFMYKQETSRSTSLCDHTLICCYSLSWKQINPPFFGKKTCVRAIVIFTE